MAARTVPRITIRITARRTIRTTARQTIRTIEAATTPRRATTEAQVAAMAVAVAAVAVEAVPVVVTEDERVDYEEVYHHGNGGDTVRRLCTESD